MNRPTLKYLVVCLVVIAALLCGGVQQASAWWHGGWGYGWGSHCGWGPCGGAWWGGCGYGCGYGDGGWGCHHAWRHCGYGCGCSDYCGCWPACPVIVSSCCGAPVMGGPVMGAPMIGGPAPGAPMMGAPNMGPTPATPQSPTPAPPASEGPAGSNPPLPGSPNPGPHADAAPGALSSGQLTIVVPADAKVFINGHQTRSIGTHREYVSYGLQSGLTYRYEVRAEVVRDGKTVEDTREVFLTAGSREGVAFDFAAKKAISVASL